jgi:glycosyltransferase involved in cell wall biosynthesis
MPSTQTNPIPKVSVIIPSYKTANLISECLDSVFAQTYSDFEVIVVNDGSPDTSELEQVLTPYMNRIVYIKQVNKRAAGARNTAIQRANGEFVAFLDSDDTWMPGHLSSQMHMLAEDPSLDLVYSNGMMVGKDGQLEFMEKCPSSGPATFGALIEERCQVAISTVVARKQTLVGAGLFDEKLPRCDDYDMWVRAAFNGARIGYSRTIGGKFFADRPGSLSQTKARMIEGYWNILEKFKQTLPLTEADREMVNKRAALIKARYLLEEGKCKIAAHQIAEGRQLISDANKYFHKMSISLALLGLSLAPSTTSQLISYWRKFRSTATA